MSLIMTILLTRNGNMIEINNSILGLGDCGTTNVVYKSEGFCPLNSHSKDKVYHNKSTISNIKLNTEKLLQIELVNTSSESNITTDIVPNSDKWFLMLSL